jgi:hypothetical protein
MPKRTDLQSILILGSAPIVIGLAAEFDYSGAAAVRRRCGAGAKEGAFFWRFQNLLARPRRLRRQVFSVRSWPLWGHLTPRVYGLSLEPVNIRSVSSSARRR